MCYIKLCIVNLRHVGRKFIPSLSNNFLSAYLCQAGCETLKIAQQRRQTAASSAHLTSPHSTELAGHEGDRG